MRKPRRLVTSERHRLLLEADSERVGRLPPEAKVKMAIDMTDAMVQTCVQGMRAQNPKVTEEECINKLHERFQWAKRWQEHGRPVE